MQGADGRTRCSLGYGVSRWFSKHVLRQPQFPGFPPTSQLQQYWLFPAAIALRKPSAARVILQSWV